MRTIRTRLVPVLVLVLALALAALGGPGATAAGAGVIAPPQPGGLTGSVGFSCDRTGTPTVTVVVHNPYDAHLGVSIWADGAVLLANLPVPGHSTATATVADASWEGATVGIDVLRIGGVVVASGVHRVDCVPDLGFVVAPRADSGRDTALRHL